MRQWGVRVKVTYYEILIFLILLSIVLSFHFLFLFSVFFFFVLSLPFLFFRGGDLRISRPLSCGTVDVDHPSSVPPLQRHLLHPSGSLRIVRQLHPHTCLLLLRHQSVSCKVSTAKRPI